MGKIFYVNTSNCASEQLITYVADKYYGLHEVDISRTQHGKPYFENLERALFFSVTHTRDKIFIVFSRKQIGLDAERLSRKVNYAKILTKFPVDERLEIQSNEDFLRHWVVRESVVKYLGGTLAKDLNKICYANERLLYNNQMLPVYLHLFNHEGHIISVCSEDSFTNAEFIQIPTHLL